MLCIYIYVYAQPPRPPQHYKKPFCTLAVRCLHAFKLAGTNRLTTAAMNILGLRIKTVCSNFEMFGHVLDKNIYIYIYMINAIYIYILTHIVYNTYIYNALYTIYVLYIICIILCYIMLYYIILHYIIYIYYIILCNIELY